jgi:hypothetical protein
MAPPKWQMPNTRPCGADSEAEPPRHTQSVANGKEDTGVGARDVQKTLTQCRRCAQEARLTAYVSKLLSQVAWHENVKRRD